MRFVYTGGSKEEARSRMMDDEEMRRGRRRRSRSFYGEEDSYGYAESFHYPDEDMEEEMRRGRRRRSRMEMEATYPQMESNRSEMESRQGQMEGRRSWEIIENNRQPQQVYNFHMTPAQQEARGESNFSAESRQMGYILSPEAHGGRGSAVGGGMMGVVKELGPKVTSLFEEASQVVKHPPQTWEQYLKNKDFEGIASMETRELMQALEGKKAPAARRKELVHVLAALMLMEK